MRTLSYVWGAVRRIFPSEACDSIIGMTMLQNELGAVFDFPIRFYQQCEKEFKVISITILRIQLLRLANVKPYLN